MTQLITLNGTTLEETLAAVDTAGRITVPQTTPASGNELVTKTYTDAQVAGRLTQAQADLRYLQLSGGVLTGLLTGTALTLTGTLTGVGATFSGQVNGITPTAAANLTRKDYVDGQIGLVAKLAANNIFTGSSQTITGATQANLVINDEDASVGGTANSTVIFQANGVQNGYIGFSGASLALRAIGSDITFQANQGAGAGSFYHYFTINNITTARVEPGGTAVPLATSVMTREKGDARYAPISDQRLKTNVQDMPDVDIMALRPRTFEWLAPTVTRPAGIRAGLIAQEVQDAFPAGVVEMEDTTLNIDLMGVIGVMVKSIQTLTARVAELEGKV